MRNLALAEGADVVFCRLGAGLGDDPGAELFAVFLVGHAHHLHVLHLGVAVQEFFNLARVDVLAATDHHVLDAADDVHVALGVHGGQVAGVHPAVGVNGLMGFGRVFPIAMHHRIALGAELATLTAGHDGAGFGVHDLDLQVRLHLAYSRYALVQRRVGAALAAHGAGFGHAVSDGDLAQVHLLHHTLHHLGGARRPGHDAGAQGAEVELGKARVVQLGNEHGGHAVQAGAALVLHRLQHRQRVKPIIGVHDGSAVRQAGQVAQHHAKAVVQRHGNAQPVFGRELHALANEEAVVQDVAVRERGALGEARGAAGELDVDGVGCFQRGRHLRQTRVGRVAACDQVTKTQQAGFVFALPSHVDPDHRVQVRQLLRLQLAGRAMRPLGRQLAQHAQVVAGLEARHGHQQLAAHLVQRIFHLGRAVGRVDVDQHQAHLRGGQLHQHPFGVVVRPDAHAITRHQPQAQQRTGQAVGFGLQLGIGVAAALVHAHQRLAVGLAGHHVGKEGADGLLDQGNIGGATGVAFHQRCGIRCGCSRHGFVSSVIRPAQAGRAWRAIHKLWQA